MPLPGAQCRLWYCLKVPTLYFNFGLCAGYVQEVQDCWKSGDKKNSGSSCDCSASQRRMLPSKMHLTKNIFRPKRSVASGWEATSCRESGSPSKQTSHRRSWSTVGFLLAHLHRDGCLSQWPLLESYCGIALPLTLTPHKTD